MTQRTPIPEDIGEYIRLDAETGKLWRIRAVNARAKAGDTALSTIDKEGYLKGSFRGVSYRAHRVVWFLHHGTQPPPAIDHIDCNPANNQPDNLRAADPSQNTSNRKKFRQSLSGVKGVYKTPWNTFQVRVGYRGVLYNGGRFKNIADAEIAVRQLREQLHGDFTNHG
jgi:hypothetical protein